jgi:N6-adenosine-specific RNA methylase IME4
MTDLNTNTEATITDEAAIGFIPCYALADCTDKTTNEAQKIKNAKRGEYCIIYADPAWKYNNKPNKKGRAVECHYKTMDIEEIKALPIKEIAAKDCILFIWVTFPKLQEGLDTIKAWGFEYKTIGFVWVKTNKNTNTNQMSWLPSDNLDSFWGMGMWTRANVELCLIATKGKPKRQSASVHSVVYAPISVHSRKPKEVRTKIIQLVGDLPRVELFARQKADGWDAWGNEIESDIKQF